MSSNSRNTINVIVQMLIKVRVTIRASRIKAAHSSSSIVLISDLFSECAQSAYTALGYNNLFGGKHLKC